MVLVLKFFLGRAVARAPISDFVILPVTLSWYQSSLEHIWCHQMIVD